MRSLIVVICMLVGAVAFAQDGGASTAPTASAATTMLEHLIGIVGAVLGAALLLLVRKATSYFEAKTKIDIPVATEAMLENVANKAVNYAKEKAYQFNQANMSKMRGPDKLEAALTFGLDLASQYKLADVARDKLVRAIEAKLGEGRQNV